MPVKVSELGKVKGSLEIENLYLKEFIRTIKIGAINSAESITKSIKKVVFNIVFFI